MWDLTEWFMMPQRETHHLEGTTLDGSPAEHLYHINTGKSMLFIKGDGGFPVEIKPFDDNGIYDWVTELDWTSPRDFKQFTPPLRMCPRYWDGDLYGNNIFIPQSPYEMWQDCKKTGSDNVKSVSYALGGPYRMHFGGDIGEALSIVLTYYWDDMNSREVLYLTREAGWCKWSLWQTAGALGTPYQLKASTLHNRIVTGVLRIEQVQFPCLQIP